MRREIVLLGDEVLRRKCKPVAAVDATTRRLMDDLAETMDAANGLGLAAPQVAVARRVIVAWDGDCDLVVLANPQIKSRVGQVTASEGCLSLPGLYGLVPRAKRVLVAGTDRTGRQVQVEAEGLLARALQHEIDHLNGVLFIDHAKELWWHVDCDDDDPQAIGEPGEKYKKVPTTLDEVREHFTMVRGERVES